MISFKKNEVPSVLGVCPIVEVAAELRFQTSLQEEAVLGYLMRDLDLEGELEQLPIAQLPTSLRRDDPNLHFLPLYRLMQGPHVIQIGPRIISISLPGTYSSWQEFSTYFLNIFGKLVGKNWLTEYTRLGLRYIDRFPGNVYDDVRLKLSVGEDSVESGNLFVRTELRDDDLTVLLQIASGQPKMLNGEHSMESIIDIDTSCVPSNRLTEEELSLKFNSAHALQKQTFFGLLTEKFLTSLNPTK